MKNKIIIGVIIVTIILLITIVFLAINKSDNDISKKGYRIFGSDYCPKNSSDYFFEDYEHPMMAGQAFTPYKCKLCDKEYNHPNTATPKICSTCATITNRCAYCGKLNNAE